MTGRIEVSATASQPGRITTNTGENTFHYEYQLPPGRTRLCVGRSVTFELEKDNANAAIGVRPIDREASSLVSPRGHRELRYQGFEQKNDIRSFKFRARRTGKADLDVIVTAELSLFRKYGITIQEGPALCFRFAEAELQQPSPTESRVWRRALSDKEMIAHLGRRRSPLKRRN